ncbi:hypothetical protein DPMN_083828, partial [Dreissena polymorpha]
VEDSRNVVIGEDEVRIVAVKENNIGAREELKPDHKYIIANNEKDSDRSHLTVHHEHIPYRNGDNYIVKGKGDLNNYQIESSKENQYSQLNTVGNKSQNVVIGERSEPLTSDTIKIISYDEKQDAPSLEREDLVSSETRQRNDLQSLVPHLLPKNFVRPRQNSVEEKCDQFSCLNNGKCVDDGTVYRRKMRCDCPLGYMGPRCDTVVNARYPKFAGNSYLALPVLANSFREIDLAFEFKPEKDNGLLFFSGEFEDAHTDFLSVSLIDGFVELRYDCGTGMGTVRSSAPVAMDKWNTLRINRTENHASLWLNQQQPVYGESQGSYTRLTLRLNLYIGGYDSFEWIKNRVGMVTGLTGCMEKVIINGYMYDLRKADLVGDAQFGVNVGDCSEGLCTRVACEHGGTCMVTSPYSHVCLCPLRTGGDNCQHVLDVHIPEFQGHSYLELKGLGRTALLFLDIEIVFKAESPNGLIVYNGYTLDRVGDFISLALDGGFIEYRFDLGTGPAIIRSRQPIKLNHWHTVKISRTGMEGVMEVDDDERVIGLSQGAFTQLTVTQNMFIGGHRNFDETSKQANVTKSFVGCIQKLIINKKHIHLLKDAISGVNVENYGHPCVGDPCLHGGLCTPHGDVFTCHCSLGYMGNTCNKKLNLEDAIPKFSSDSFLKYTHDDIIKRIVGNRLDVHISIKTTSYNGLFLWSGPDQMENNSDYFALGFIDGALHFRYNLGSGEAILTYNNSKLFDGNWHYIYVQRTSQNAKLSINGKDIVQGSSKGSYTMLNTNNILYIGGLQDVEQRTLGRFKSGFSGCLRDLVLDEKYTLDMLTIADSGRNIKPCL